MHPTNITMSQTQYICPETDDMKDRTGHTFNDITTTDMYSDMMNLCHYNNDNTQSFNSSNPNTFCNTCFKLINLLVIAETYGKELRGETNYISVNNNDKQTLYNAVRKNVNDFISSLDNYQFDPCTCKLPSNDISYFDNLDDLNDLVVDKQYSNYEGHVSERTLYRKYHRNFIKFLKFLDGSHDIQGFVYVLRDFQKIKEELIHWSKFFNQEHCVVIEQKRMTTKTVKEIRNISEDCLNHVLSFVH
jgi:hypothetical protein